MPTTPRGVPYPAAGAPNNVPGDLQALAEWVDDRPGIATMTSPSRAALTGGQLWPGREVYETDTGRLMLYAGTGGWQQVESSRSQGWTALAVLFEDPVGGVASVSRCRIVGKTLVGRVHITAPTGVGPITFLAADPTLRPAPAVSPAGIAVGTRAQVVTSGSVESAPIWVHDPAAGHLRCLLSGSLTAVTLNFEYEIA